MSFDDALLGRIAERAIAAGVRLVAASASDLAVAESAIGMDLPTSLRQLYLEVGDGGFGPGLDVAISGYPAGKLYSLARLVEVHRSNQEILEDEQDPFPHSPWPADVVQFSDLGGFSSIAVDCRGPAHPVLEYESDVDEVEPERAWTVIAPSVEDWFADWINGREPPQRETWPGRREGS